MTASILRKALIGLFTLVIVNASIAHEGMWIPSTLAKLVIGDMQDAGLKLSAEDIYAINKSSIKDAIVHFGGGCTASVISEEGLILTNHHCGYSQIQTHSSLENDYLKDGFWAMTKNDELTNPGLTATFVVRIEDVTSQIMRAMVDLPDAEKDAAIAAMSNRLANEAIAGTHYEAEVKPFLYGNAYYMIVTETYRDVRLVGAPPSSVGKFGGDTDNWVWPRHTGDFSLFRIYADANNMPADYSEDNVPYAPKHSLAINMDGLEPGDFTMVFGFPGRTFQYLTSYAVDYTVNVENPDRIAMREASLGVIDAAMESSDETRIQYAAKQSRISNAYKKWIGQNMGLERYDAIGMKQAKEKAFYDKAMSTKGYEGAASLLSEFDVLYAKSEEFNSARNYFIEFYYYGPEMFRFAARFMDLLNPTSELTEEEKLEKIDKLKEGLPGFYKNYNAEVDEGIMAAQWPLFDNGCPEVLSSETLDKYLGGSTDVGTAVAKLYGESILDNQDGLAELLDKSTKKVIKTLRQDPIYDATFQLIEAYRGGVSTGYGLFKDQENALMKAYLEALMVIMPDHKYVPDANSTMRLTYGVMEGSEPRDGVVYEPFTTMDGIISKYIPGDKEFDVPAKLLELHANQDYGQYATDGELRVCFLGSNHTTGGNSGSPTLDQYGHLVGLNFDRTWESTMSDIMFSEEICRNIMVDIKYVLFIADKYAGAGHLVEEMNLVWPEQEAALRAE